MALMLTVHPDLCTRHPEAHFGRDLVQEAHTVSHEARSGGGMMSMNDPDVTLDAST